MSIIPFLFHFIFFLFLFFFFSFLPSLSSLSLLPSLLHRHLPTTPAHGCRRPPPCSGGPRPSPPRRPPPATSSRSHLLPAAPAHGRRRSSPSCSGSPRPSPPGRPCPWPPPATSTRSGASQRPPPRRPCPRPLPGTSYRGGVAANGTRTGGGGVTAAVRGLHRRRSVDFAAPALPTRCRRWSPKVCPVSPEVRGGVPCVGRGPAGRGTVGRKGRSRLEPRKRGSSSPLEAARGSSSSSSSSSTPGAGANFTVWQGSVRSRPWSLAKRDLYNNPGRLIKK